MAKGALEIKKEPKTVTSTGYYQNLVSKANNKWSFNGSRSKLNFKKVNIRLSDLIFYFKGNYQDSDANSCGPVARILQQRNRFKNGTNVWFILSHRNILRRHSAPPSI